MCKGSTRLISTASMEQGCTALYVSHVFHLLQALDNSNHLLSCLPRDGNSVKPHYMCIYAKTYVKYLQTPIHYVQFPQANVPT